MEIDFIRPITDRLAGIQGVVAVALGGSYARGTQRPDSDIDLGLYYRDASPFSIEAIKLLAAEINDSPDPVVTDFHRWGPWVNGGAWLTVQGQRVDLLYRSLDRLQRVIEDCRRGLIESDYYQQPPHGFHSYVYLGELSVCRPLYDPEGTLATLKTRLVPYPQPLKRAIANRFLWGAQFDLAQAQKYAQQGDVYAATGAFARVSAALVQVAYALNERYFISDRGTPAEIESFPHKPAAFADTLTAVLARPGDSPARLAASASRLDSLLQRLIYLAGDLYSPPDFRA